MTDFNPMKDKQDTPKVGVGVIIENDDAEIFLMRRKGSHGAGQWSLPGGHQDIGETAQQCCLREVEEETGLKLTGWIYKLGFMDTIMESEGLHYITLYYGASSFKGSPTITEPEKCDGIGWFSRYRLPDPMFGRTKDMIDDLMHKTTNEKFLVPRRPEDEE